MIFLILGIAMVVSFGVLQLLQSKRFMIIICPCSHRLEENQNSERI
jgi:hypothetical protein